LLANQITAAQTLVKGNDITPSPALTNILTTIFPVATGFFISLYKGVEHFQPKRPACVRRIFVNMAEFQRKLAIANSRSCSFSIGPRAKPRQFTTAARSSQNPKA
jgi:hypothetical protein